MPNKYKALVKNRKRDINLQIGLAQFAGNKTFYQYGQRSTFHKKYLKGKKLKKVNIIVDTLANICRKYIQKNEDIQFCKIDVEGEERNVLLGFDFKKYRPKVFCIESTIPGRLIPNHNLWEDILLRNI